MRMIFATFFCILLFVGGQCSLLASTNSTFSSSSNNSVNYANSDMYLKEVKKRDSTNGFSGEVGFRSNALVDDVGEVPGNEYFGFFSLDYKQERDKSFKKYFSFQSRINNEDVLEYSIPKAYVEFEYTNSRFALGRLSLPWSYTDQVWGLGKINNRINFNYFEPGDEGLVGFVYDRKFSSGFDISIFASGIYIPEMSQGLNVDEENRTVSCLTPWCNAPAANAPINGKDIPIFYDVNYPDNDDVIYRRSLGYKIGYALDEKFNLSFFHLNKPENEISISAEVVVLADFSSINVDVTPQFYYHDVIGHNVEYNFSDELKLYASRIAIVPNQFPDGDQQYIEYTGIKPKKKREDYISTGVYYKDVEWSFHSGYIARVSEFDTENDILVSYPRWNQAINIALRKRFSRRSLLSFDFKYDMLTEDRLTMLEANYMFNSGAVAAIGMNMIGTNQNKDSFWSQYENNDSLYSSLSFQY